MRQSLEKCTEVVVRVAGREYKGEVVGCADNWGTPEEPNWYIEFKTTSDGVYRYWKQSYDGGVLHSPKL